MSTSRIMGASRKSKPLSSHPAFPALVALWFAALLGLGTFVVPPASFEGLVVGTGIDAMLPFAAPPLGETARLAISIAAALAGAALGLFVAWRVRKAHTAQTAPDSIADEEEFEDSPWLSDEDEDETLAVDLDEDLTEPDPSPDWDSWHAELREVETASQVEVAEEDVVLEEDTPEMDDTHRHAADRLVAGLPLVGREELGEDPVASWLSDEDDADPVPVSVEAPLADADPDDMTSEVSDIESPHADPVPAPAADFSDFSLAELVERFDAALAATGPLAMASKDGEPQSDACDDEVDEGEVADDPVIAFLRREVDRDDGARATATLPMGRQDDPQTVLRTALDKLDRVRQTS